MKNQRVIRVRNVEIMLVDQKVNRRPNFDFFVWNFVNGDYSMK